MSLIIQRGKPKDAVVVIRGGGNPWLWQRQSMAVAVMMGEFEFWVLILEEGNGEFYV